MKGSVLRFAMVAIASLAAIAISGPTVIQAEDLNPDPVNWEAWDEAIMTPAWESVIIAACYRRCEANHTTRKALNVCYTCDCLVPFAEDPGEYASARAQCANAQSWPS